MFPPQVFEQRRQLSDMIAALPPEVLKDNAAALLNLLNEFQRSLALELRVIGSVEDLNVDDAAAMTAFYRDFKRYVNDRTFDLERTRCSQIQRIYDVQIKSRRQGTVDADDPYARYELGVTVLKGRLTRDHNDYPVVLVYEQRLAENVRKARPFDDSTLRAERNEIISYLNDLAMTDLGISFNDLCAAAVAMTPTLTPAEAQQVEALGQFLQQFRGYDNDFTEQIEAVTNQALTAMVNINQAVTAGDLTTARQEHAAFVATYEPELRRARETIRAMSDTGNQLIDLLAS